MSKTNPPLLRGDYLPSWQMASKMYALSAQSPGLAYHSSMARFLSDCLELQLHYIFKVDPGERDTVKLFRSTAWKVKNSHHHIEIKVMPTGRFSVSYFNSGRKLRAAFETEDPCCHSLFLHFLDELSLQPVKEPLPYRHTTLYLGAGKYAESNRKLRNEVYPRLNGWNTPHNQEAYWYGTEKDDRYIRAAEYGSGLVISGEMEEKEWNNWLENFKELASGTLGFPVEEKTP